MAGMSLKEISSPEGKISYFHKECNHLLIIIRFNYQS